MPPPPVLCFSEFCVYDFALYPLPRLQHRDITRYNINTPKNRMMRRSALRRFGTSFGATVIPPITNERMDGFAPGSKERDAFAAACKRARGTVADCPIVIGGVEHRPSKQSFTRTMPSDHKVTIATGYNATAELASMAVENSLATFESWSRTPFQDRAAILLKAAHLISTKYRAEVQAATALGQSKNAWQAEIDCIAETADFLRFNSKYASQLYHDQPISPSSAAVWNMVEYRPLEGFVAAISPFNFTAIGANLATAPVLMGNCVIWKPSPSAILSNYQMYKIFEEAGLPPGVINFLPCEADVMSTQVMQHESLAGVAFTGSTAVFNAIQKNIGNHLDHYRSYPRVSGETGGKNFHLLHPSCNVNHAVASTVRSAFEYQGQKCSACSRMYVPRSLWAETREKLIEATSRVVVGQPDDFRSFVCAVIDGAAYRKVTSYIEKARAEEGCSIIAGGTYSDTEGWFVAPTIIEATNPLATTMREEIFGPVLTVHVYDDNKWDETLKLVNRTTKYGLTGAIFSNDRSSVRQAADVMRFGCGNLYINDKSTGAVVGQQPFGGARASGSNDKPGAPQFLHRWVSARTIKENFDINGTISYPHQLPDVVTVQ